MILLVDVQEIYFTIHPRAMPRAAGAVGLVLCCDASRSLDVIETHETSATEMHGGVMS